MDGYNQWPSGSDFHSEFREIVEKYYDECTKLSKILMESILKYLAYRATGNKDIYSVRDDSVVLYSRSLDTNNNTQTVKLTTLFDLYNKHSSFLRLNFYPPSDTTNATLTGAVSSDGSVNSDILTSISSFGVSRHTDAGLLTILLQDDVAGLEVYTGSKQDANDGEWVAVDPIPNALTINIGDMLQVLSNDLFKAAEHRVRATPASATKPRFSAPFFYNPDYNTVITSIVTSPHHSTGSDSMNSIYDTSKARYKPLRWGDFRSSRFLGDYSDVGREIQIEDFQT